MSRYVSVCPFLFFFFFNDPATTEIYPLSLPAPLPICPPQCRLAWAHKRRVCRRRGGGAVAGIIDAVSGHSHDGFAGQTRRLRSEEHTSELQSQSNLVCRLLLEKKKKRKKKRADLRPHR